MRLEVTQIQLHGRRVNLITVSTHKGPSNAVLYAAAGTGAGAAVAVAATASNTAAITSTVTVGTIYAGSAAVGTGAGVSAITASTAAGSAALLDAAVIASTGGAAAGATAVTVALPPVALAVAMGCVALTACKMLEFFTRPSVFISHSSADGRGLYNNLQTAFASMGWRAFNFETDFLGEVTKDAMRKAVRKHDIVIVCLTPRFFQSNFTHVELSEAHNHSKLIVPVFDGSEYIYKGGPDCQVMGMARGSIDPWSIEEANKLVYKHSQIVRVIDPVNQAKATTEAMKVVEKLWYKHTE